MHPLLKTSGLQLINKNFRPLSNLQFTSKLYREGGCPQLQEHMRVKKLKICLFKKIKKQIGKNFKTFIRNHKVLKLLSRGRYLRRVLSIGTLRYIVGHPGIGDVLRIGSAIIRGVV